jgi:hypothetical protein
MNVVSIAKNRNPWKLNSSAKVNVLSCTRWVSQIATVASEFAVAFLPTPLISHRDLPRIKKTNLPQQAAP